MQLPNGGRIVLIDDTREEAFPLMETFGRYSIPYLYYDGTAGKLPDNPPGGVRFVFLDIELQGMRGQDDKTKASGLTACLKKIISASNGPYVIIFWTKLKQEVIELVIQNCTKAAIPPVSWLDLEKTECIKPDKSYDMQKLSKKLREKLSSIGAFRLYVEWENALHSASKKFICEFSNLVPSGEGWSEGTSALFYKLYKSYVDKNEIQDQAEQFKCACLLMNCSFLDTLQSISATDFQLPDGFRLASGNIDGITLAKLNTSLFLNNSLLSRPATGYVYREENESLQSSLIESLFKKDGSPVEIQLCKIIITPECDLAQNKTLKHRCESKERKMHRIIYGLLFPFSDDLKSYRKKNDAQFEVGAIWHEGQSYALVLHFSTLSFQHEGELSGNPLFALKRDLVFDIQSKAANHVNRLGNFQLG